MSFREPNCHVHLYGMSVSWIGFRGPQTGIARVIPDGNVVADSLDTYAPKDASQNTVFTLSGLAAVSHTLMIEVTGQKNPASADVAIVVDAFDVTRENRARKRV